MSLDNLLSREVSSSQVSVTSRTGYTQLRPFEKPGFANLEGWQIGKKDVFVRGADGSFHPVKGFWATGVEGEDSHTFSDPVGKVWTPIQPDEIAEVVRLVAQIMGADENSVRSFRLNNGERFGAIVELPGHLTSIGTESDRQIRCVAVTCGQDGTAAKGAAYMNRLLCQNRFPAFFKSVISGRAPKIRGVRDFGKTSISIRHTKNGAERIKEAEQLAATLTEAFLTTEQIAGRLADIRTDRDGLLRYFKAILPDPTLTDNPTAEDKAEFEELMEKGRTIRGGWLSTVAEEMNALGVSDPTAWLAINAVTKYEQHTVRVTKDPDGARRFAGVLPGGNLMNATEDAIRAGLGHFGV